MNDEIKKHGVLIIEADRETRSYYNLAISSKEFYTTFSAATAQEAYSIIEGAGRDDFSFVVLSSKISDVNFCIISQKLREYISTFQSEIILISNENSQDILFLLEELGIKKILPERVETNKLLDVIDKLRINKDKNKDKNYQITEILFALKNQDTEKIEKLKSENDILNILLNNYEYSYIYCEILILEKRFEERIDFAKNTLNSVNAAEEKLNTLSVLSSLAKSLCFLDRYDEAMIIYNEMAIKSPRNLNHKISIGNTLIVKAEWRKALEIFDSVLQSDPSNKQALLGAAESNVGLGNIKAAKNYIDNIAGTVDFRVLSSFFNNRAIVYARNHDYKKAIEFYKNALFFNSKETTAILFNIGVCLLRENFVDKALGIFEKIKSLEGYTDLEKKKTILNNLIKKIKK